MKLALVSAAAVIGLLTACSSAVSYVNTSDPVIGICQQSAVLNITTPQNAIDNANNNPGGISGSGIGKLMTQGQVNQIQADAKIFAADAAQLSSSHPDLASDFQDEASLFLGSVSQGNGLTTNTIAVAVDKYTGLINNSCGSFRVGTAPSKPVPSAWSWSLFGIAVGGYVIMILATSMLIAFSEREKPRDKRLSAGLIFCYSVIWWGALFILGARIYRQIVERMKLTPGDRKDDRMSALTRDVKRLEQENARLAKKNKKL